MLKTGIDLYRFRDDTIGGTFFGTMYFGSIYTSDPAVADSGAPFADFLLGLPTSLDGGQMLQWGRLRQIYSGEYIQDDWKATPKLTFNLGLRYDLWTVPVDARNVGGFLDVKTGHIALPGKGGYSRGIIAGDHNNFAPRFGFAFQVRPKMVVRGGYGIYFAQQEKNGSSGVMSALPPNTPVFSVPPVSATQTVTPPFTIAGPILGRAFRSHAERFFGSSPSLSNSFYIGFQ